jgi:hypothetical protein
VAQDARHPQPKHMPPAVVFDGPVVRKREEIETALGGK